MKKYSIKEILELIIIFCLFTYIVGAVTEYFFARNLLLLRSNIREADILFEMNSREYGVGTTHIIYLKENELGFISTGPSRYSFTRHGYSLFNRYNKFIVDTASGETNVTLSENVKYFGDRYFPGFNVESRDLFLYSTYVNAKYGDPNFKHVYWGVKHNDVFMFNGEEISPEFIYYLDEAFGGVYVFYFETNERLDTPIDLTFGFLLR